MVQVNFTSHLEVFFPTLKSQKVEAQTLSELFSNLNQLYPGISSYLIEDNGEIRKHVNVFLDGVLIENKSKKNQSLEGISEVFILQALSGG
jgi:molybdopterin synthase sulfur carrier subunit